MATPQRPPAVVLVGFMGAGKSAVGRRLADRLGLPYLDTDDLIVAAAGPIAAVFTTRGERGFRALESETAVREIDGLGRAPKVLALGGGAVLSDDVRAALSAAAAHVVWLTAPAAELWRRVKADAGAERPLAQDEEAFGALLAAREALYRRVATLVVDTSGREPGEVAADIAKLVDDAPTRRQAGHAGEASGEGAA